MSRGPRSLLALVLSGALLLGACRDDEAGPGVVEVRVSAGIPLGAVALEITGEGITGVQDLSQGWVLGASQDNGEAMPSFRVVAVAEQAGDFLLRVNVARASGALPTVEVVQASRVDDLVVPDPGDVLVEVQRVD